MCVGFFVFCCLFVFCFVFLLGWVGGGGGGGGGAVGWAGIANAHRHVIYVPSVKNQYKRAIKIKISDIMVIY